MVAFNQLDDEYDDDFDGDNFRWMSVIILLLAVFGFFALAWYAYNHGADQARNQDIIIIEAEDRPLKMAPESAGGMEFPHQDKQIYDVMREKKPPLDTAVNTIVPETEKPIAASGDTPIRTWVNKDLHPAGNKEDILIDESLAKAQAEKAVKKTNPVLDEKAKTLQAILKKSPEKSPVTSSNVAPPVRTVKAAPAPIATPVKSVPKLSNQLAKVPAASNADSGNSASGTYASGFKVQLGAFRSDSDAQTQWVKIRKNHLDVLSGLGHNVVRADLGAKGVYYRLRVGGLANAEKAKALCATLSARKQPCISVGK